MGKKYVKLMDVCIINLNLDIVEISHETLIFLSFIIVGVEEVGPTEVPLGKYFDIFDLWQNRISPEEIEKYNFVFPILLQYFSG